MASTTKSETAQERALRQRAKRLGYRVRRRHNTYELTDADGTGFGGDGIEAVVWWLDVIEHKLPVQISTACGVPLFKINAAEAGARSNER